jgi:hypothetical protein
MISSNPLSDWGLATFAFVANFLSIANVHAALSLRNEQTSIRIEPKKLEGVGNDIEEENTILLKNQKNHFLKNVDLSLPNLNSFFYTAPSVFAGIYGLFVVVNAAPNISNELPMGVSIVNLLLSLPSCIRIIESQRMWSFAQKQAANITQDTVKEYAAYAYTQNIPASSTNKVTLPLNHSDVKHRHTTNFAEQARNNPLIAQDQKLSRKVFDNIFSCKGVLYDNSLDKLQQARKNCRSLTLTARQDDVSHEITQKVIRGQWEAMSHIKAQNGKPNKDPLLPNFDHKDKAVATLIQKNWRGYQVRKDAITLNSMFKQ